MANCRATTVRIRTTAMTGYWRCQQWKTCRLRVSLLGVIVPFAGGWWDDKLYWCLISIRATTTTATAKAAAEHNETTITHTLPTIAFTFTHTRPVLSRVCASASRLQWRQGCVHAFPGRTKEDFFFRLVIILYFQFTDEWRPTFDLNF